MPRFLRRSAVHLLRLAAPACFGLSVFSWLPAIAQTGLVAPYLQSATPTSIVIKWETNTNTESIVEYGLTPALGASQSGNAMTTLGSTQLHDVTLTNLTPATRYYYMARTGSWQSDIHDFETPPLRDSEAPLNIVLMSDMQKDGGNPNIFNNLVNTSLLPYIEDQYGTPLSDKLQMAMLPGDLVDVGSNYNQWKNDFFNPAEALWRTVPCYPAIGNHEGNSQNYFNYFTLPANGTPGYLEHWYATDYSNVRVLSFNTNGGYRIQAQLDWLDSMLLASCSDTLIDFVFAQMHHPYRSELWIAGNTDYTGQIIDRLETFSTECGKPTVHFYGHTHGYSRGQSRDHEHLWVNVATAGGNIDYWGEFAQQDYEEFIISTDDYGFVMVEVSAGTDAKFVMKRLSFGDQYNPGGSVVTDSMVIRLNNTPPAAPYPLFPIAQDTVSPLCTTFKADGFSDPDGDGFGAAHWQVALDSAGFGTPAAESWKQYANWYNESNSQASDDLTDETFDDLPAGSTLWWRVRYRDKSLGWSAWSIPSRFQTLSLDTLTGNLVQNPGAEAGTTNWTATIGFLESLTPLECSGIHPHSGDRYFAVGALCQEAVFASAYQDLSVSGQAAPIDSGIVMVHYGAYLANYQNTDEPSFALQFLDAGGTPISGTDTIRHNQAAWTLKQNTQAVPAGTRTIRFILMGTRTAGLDNDSYVDDIFLRLFTGLEGCSSFTLPGPANGRVYVDHDAPAHADGKSWPTAYRSLGDALVQTNADTLISEIWIAEGIYPVTSTDNRSLSYFITRGISIYGGFDGSEWLLAERDIMANPVVLSGEIGDTGLVSDNSYHVITVAGITDTLRLDGLVITGGFADGISHEEGGGLRTRVSNAEPVILESCEITGNAGTLAGTIYNESELLISESLIEQTEEPGMTHIMILNAGPQARLILSNTTVVQHGIATPEGIHNMDGAEIRIANDAVIERSDD